MILGLVGRMVFVGVIEFWDRMMGSEDERISDRRC